MITVTTPSAINTITPVMDGVANPATIGTALPNEGFTTALNAQLNLVSPPVTEGAALASAQAALLAANSATVSTDVLANAATTTLTTQQPAVLTETTAQNSTLLTAPTITSQTPLAETVMTTEDSAILSNVTDTLKFIATGAKLGDTLSTGQSVQLPTANSATPLTQQTVQSAVQQAVTNKQVSTPATVLAQQATPVQVAQIATTQTSVTEVQAQTLTLSQQAQTVAASVQVQTPVVSQQTPAVTTQSQTPVAQQQATVVTAQVKTLAAASQTAQVQAPVTQQTATTETPIAAQTQTPVVAKQSTASVQTAVTQPQASAVNGQNQTLSVAQQIETPEQAVITTQAQTPVAQQAQASAEKSVITASPVQTPVAQQDVLIETAQVQTSVAQPQTPVATAQAQNAVTQSQTVPVVATQVSEQASVKVASVQTAVTQQATPVETAQVQKQAQKPAETTTVQVALAQQTSATEAVAAEQIQVQQPVSQQSTAKTDKTSTVKTEENTPVEPSLVIETALQTVEQNVVVPEKSSESVAQNFAESETQKSQHQDAPAVQTVVENNAPIVTAQSAPAQVETEVATFDAPTSSAPEDKPTLTPAKNLLADVLANRGNGGDTAGNSSDKRGGDTPSNPTVQADSLLKTATDGKQGLDTKSFASLLNSEKSDVMTATATAPTADKVAPQVATAAVNKLAQDMKAEVPALTRPLSHPAWNQEMGERIVWMNNQGISSAEIKMNPQNMGPITVRIDMNQDQATIAFTAQNSDVRNALEASIPKLREMLNSQNVNLADVNVSQQSSTSADSGRSQQQTAQMAADASANGQGNRQANQEVDANGNPVRQINANGEEVIVDEFANGHELGNNGANGLLSIYA